MGNIYYALGLLFIVFNLFYLSRYGSILKIKEWYDAFAKVSKRKPLPSDAKGPVSPDDINLLTGIYVIGIVEFIWTLLGLLGGSWKVFLALFIIYGISGILRNFLKPFSISSKILGYLTLFIKTITFCLLVINHFHLHIDLFNEFFLCLLKI